METPPTEPGTSCCTAVECHRPVRARGLCSMHYTRKRRADGRACAVAGCAKPEFGRSYCSMHYERWKKDGDVGEAAPRIASPLRGISDRERRLIKRYGLTQEAFDALLASQDGGCALCGAETERWHVDHDHECCPGKKSCGRCVRGILCAPCNTGLWFVERHRDRLAEIESYIDRRKVAS